MPYQRKAGDPPDGAWLPKEKLIDGQVYSGRCRNAEYATWKKQPARFVYVRYKFGSFFLESLPHPDDDAGYDVFFPFKEAAQDKMYERVPEEKRKLLIDLDTTSSGG